MDSPELIDVGLAKALNNPMRQAILTALRTGDPQTSTSLAEHLGVTTGATSYHLRLLADQGLVEEVERDGRGRQRWWRAAVADLRATSTQDRLPEPNRDLDDLVHGRAEHDLATFARLLSSTARSARVELPFSLAPVMLTTTQLQGFYEEYLALLQRYRRATRNPDPAAQMVQVCFIALPDPEEAEVESPGPEMRTGRRVSPPAS